MTFARIHRIVLLLALLWSAGCRDQPPSTLPTVKMQLGNKQFTLEVAADDESRMRGLMRRDSMPADHGMIFVFRETKPLSFYMKNTRIPLDIIYVGGDAKVVSIRHMQPHDETSVPSGAPAKWAIELNEGAAAKAGVTVGDVLQIPEAAKNTSQ